MLLVWGCSRQELQVAVQTQGVQLQSLITFLSGRSSASLPALQSSCFVLTSAPALLLHRELGLKVPRGSQQLSFERDHFAFFTGGCCCNHPLAQSQESHQ